MTQTRSKMSHQPSASPPSLSLPTTTTAASTSTMSPATTPSNPDLTHFLTHPWCAALLSAPDTTLLPTPSRVPKESTEDSFFAITLRTGDTIPYMLSFSSPRPSDGVVADAATDPSAPPLAPGIGTEQVSTLFALGDALNGYPTTAHGGLIAALFDEAMGVSMMRLRSSAANPKCPLAGTDIVTASLKVDFVRRLATPGVVVVRVWVAERRGRKWVLEGEMLGVGEGGEGEGGMVVGRARGVWVEVRASL
ncbi:hypothetical protein VC83_02854 [Pseudogymnoascus destructans]|uniref:Thioesterase domain-containing protein n=1 Tax=Pseudogymnoascus destructans TaxID=655981 RepID=A0A177AG17_9PEZI|nr:uncharacterized protein VC83_02854 [Pseudogymnoascus destructans]OAF60104.2 hypothetical protein VC83_02854 [Pseudogymnoascus destructans]